MSADQRDTAVAGMQHRPRRGRNMIRLAGAAHERVPVPGCCRSPPLATGHGRLVGHPRIIRRRRTQLSSASAPAWNTVIRRAGDLHLPRVPRYLSISKIYAAAEVVARPCGPAINGKRLIRRSGNIKDSYAERPALHPPLTSFTLEITLFLSRMKRGLR
jgi:hypothetical protein